ncbi:MAG: GNAT family N-acetyltransferase [Rickettsiales bacterium]
MTKLNKFSPSESLTAKHDIDDFQSGEIILDDWLRKRALANNELAASKTYVSCFLGTRKVAGYYSLSMGHVLNQEVIGSMRRNMPKNIPVVVLGRLAIDQSCQGVGLGVSMLQDAVKRSIIASEQVSARLLIVHAISQNAEQFYLHHGFIKQPIDTPMLAFDLTRTSK